MKRALLILLFPLLATCTVAAQDIAVSYQTFYDDLSPYGQWINDPEYGYVWVPNVDDDFRPYFTSGYWVMTEFGNTWVSDYPWGWACFHYGRWIYNDFYGWIWMPGYEWGPGWVAWRWGSGLCGWAPLYPGVAWVGTAYSCPDDWWIFIHPRHLYHNGYHNHWRRDFLYGPRHTRVLIQRTQFVSNTYEYNSLHYYSGPRAAEVQQITRQPVPIYSYGNTNTKGGERIESNRISTFRPTRIDRTNANGSIPVPNQLIQAPRRITSPGELNANWNRPRQFKLDQQRQNAQWNRPFIRNAPPYTPNPQPIRQPNAPRNPMRFNNQPTPQIRPGGNRQPSRPTPSPSNRRR